MEATVKWFIYAALAALLWSTIGVGYKLAVLAGAHGDWLIVGRPLVGGLVAAAMALARRHRPTRWSIVIGFCALGPLFMFYPIAVSYIGASLAAILLYTAPLWVTALSPLLGEEVPLSEGILALLGFLGVFLVSLPGIKAGEAVGIMIGLGSGLSYAFYMALARYASRKGVDEFEIGVMSQVFAFLEVLIAIRPSLAPNIYDMLGSLYLGVFTMIIPYMLHVRALSLAQAHRVAIVSLLEPIGAVILARLLLGESLETIQAVGALLVLASAAIILLETR